MLRKGENVVVKTRADSLVNIAIILDTTFY